MATKLRDLIVQLEQAMAPTRKLPKHWKPEPKKPSPNDAPAHHTPDLAKKHGPSTSAPTRKVAPGALPKSPKKPLKPGEKMVFGRVVKTK